MNLDSKGLIVQSSGDGGDTLQREGYWFEAPGVPLNKMAPYYTAFMILNTPNGLVRSWQAPYNNPSDTSRDQLVPNVRCCGYRNLTIYLKQILWATIKNFSRYPNGDIAFLQDYGRFARSFRAWYLYPLLPLFDIPLVVNALLICFLLARTPGKWQIWLASKVSWLFWLTNQYGPNAEGVPQSPYGPTNTSNDINFIGDLTQAQRMYPTPVSWLARKIYKRFRPSGVQFALDSYFSAASGGNPEFAQLWAPIVGKF